MHIKNEKTIKVLKKISQLGGISVIVIAILCLVYFVKKMIFTKYDIDLLKSFIIIIFSATLIYFGIRLYKDYLQLLNLLILVFPLTLMLSILEIVLSTGYFDNLTSDTPIWIPYHYRVMNDEINMKHSLRSAENKYGFNDIERDYSRKTKDQYRIAVLGDSFIWGAAVDDSIIWSHRLQNKFDEIGLNVEILHWGIDSWSSKDEINFLEKFGYRFDIDMIIVGVVVNDVDIGRYSMSQLIDRGYYFYKVLQKTLLKVFPNSISFIIDYLNAFSNGYLNYGYANWLKKSYKKENLSIWKQIIRSMISYGKEHNVDILFVLTPENHSPILRNYFNKLDSILTGLDAKVLNLYPVIESKLKKYSNRQLWANPADGHPGNRVTEVYAEYTFQYLMSKGIRK